MDSWKLSPIGLLLNSPRTNAGKTATRFAARYSTFPSWKHRVRPASAASAGKTSTPACCRFPVMPILMKWALPIVSSPTKSPIFAIPPPNPTTRRVPMASRISIISRASCAPAKRPGATPRLRKLPKRDWALNYSIGSAAIFVTSKRSPPPLPVRRSTAAPSPSLRRLPPPQCRHRRRHRRVHDRALWQEHVPDHLEKPLHPRIQQHRKQNPHRPALGRPPAFPSHARRRLRYPSRRHPPPRRRGRSRHRKIQKAETRGKGGPPRILALALNASNWLHPRSTLPARPAG